MQKQIKKKISTGFPITQIPGQSYLTKKVNKKSVYATKGHKLVEAGPNSPLITQLNILKGQKSVRDKCPDGKGTPPSLQKASEVDIVIGSYLDLNMGVMKFRRFSFWDWICFKFVCVSNIFISCFYWVVANKVLEYVIIVLINISVEQTCNFWTETQ